MHPYIVFLTFFFFFFFFFFFESRRCPDLVVVADGAHQGDETIGLIIGGIVSQYASESGSPHILKENVGSCFV